MKICIFSDVHGNLEALYKMIEQDGDADYFIFAGDIFGYFYEQKQIIDFFLSTSNVLAVKGNHERDFLENDEYKEKFTNRYGSSYMSILSGTQKKYIEELPDHLEIEIDGKYFGIFHGGIEDYLYQRIYPDSHINMELIRGKYDYVIVGHTHYRMLRVEKTTTIVNPGSLGQPRDGRGFSYCILDTNSNEIQFKEVKVNIQNLLKQVKEKDFQKKVYRYLFDKYGGVE